MEIEIILGVFIGLLISVILVYKYSPFFSFWEKRKEKEDEENKKSKSNNSDLD